MSNLSAQRTYTIQPRELTIQLRVLGRNPFRLLEERLRRDRVISPKFEQ